jgi:Flp pilus assembly protein TadG
VLARSDERGSAIAEFMLVFMLVVTLFFAMFEFGLMLNSRLVLLAACRDGARRAAVEGGATAADVVGLVRKVQMTVRDVHGIELRPEIRFLGDFEQPRTGE